MKRTKQIAESEDNLMTKKTGRLELLQIPKPCPSDWENMVGNERKRFCTACHKYVYNLSAMTRREAEALIEDSQGRICARFTRLADGEISTYEPPITSRHLTRRPSPIAAALITAMMSLSPAIASSQPLSNNKLAAHQTVSGKKKPSLPVNKSTGSISGVVKDMTDTAIEGADVMLVNESFGDLQTTKTADDGTFRFEGLNDNIYIVKVESPGFKTSKTHGIHLSSNDLQKAEVKMEITMSVAATMGEIVVVANPLRSLYTNSDRVVTARVGDSTVVETAGESKTLMTTLNVSSTLKGSSHQATLYLYHSIYGDEQRLFKHGDNLLLFLVQKEKQKKQKAGYELFDSSRGVKKLSDSDLKAYARHINELANYLKDGNLENEELVEWLVRCAEDRATRWEGATELASNARSLRDRHEEHATEEESNEAEEPDAINQGSDIVTNLSDTQKERLVKALLSVEKFNDGDLELLDVVSYLKDSRMVPFLVSHLHHLESGPPRYAENLMNTLADFLRDEIITEAVEKYSDEVSYEDLEDEGDSSEEIDEQLTVEKAGEKKAAIEHRSQLLKEFLSLVEKRLSQPIPLN
jgi:hypothetical protein